MAQLSTVSVIGILKCQGNQRGVLEETWRGKTQNSLEDSCNHEAFGLYLPHHLRKHEGKGKQEGSARKEKMKRGEGKRKESWREREMKATNGNPCLSHRSILPQNNLSTRSLGHCGQISPDWGFRGAEKACHCHLSVYC